MSLPLVIFLLVLCVLAVLIAGLLRWLGLAGSAVVGGLVMGVVMGPTMLGRLAPDWYEVAVVGGQDERSALEVWQLVREGAPRSIEQVAALTADELAEEQRMRDALAEARWAHQSPTRVLSLVVAGLFLMLSGLVRPRSNGPRPDWYVVGSVGLWSALVPACALLVVGVWLELGWPELLGGAAAVGCGAVFTRAVDEQTAEAAEVGGGRLMRWAARVAMVIALGFLIAGVLLGQPELGAVGFVGPGVAVGAVGLGWLLPVGRGENSKKEKSLRPDPPPRASLRGRGQEETIDPDPSPNDSPPRSGGATRLDRWIVPILSALLAVHLELFEHFNVWLVLLVLVVSGDGRWLGSFLGAVLSSARRTLPSMRLVMGAMSAGTAQLAVGLIGLSSGLLSEELALALVIGAVAMEMSGRLRSGMARRIEETERELDEMSGEQG